MSVISFDSLKWKNPTIVRFLFAPPLGLEPRTYRLTADRSAIELWWNIDNVENNSKSLFECQAQKPNKNNFFWINMRYDYFMIG